MANKGIQIKTLHGVPIPPRNVVDRSHGYTLRFVLTGHIPSKKNRVVAVVERFRAVRLVKEWFNRRRQLSVIESQLYDLLSRCYGKIVNTKDYIEWEETAVEKIRGQMQTELKRFAESKGLIFPIQRASLALYFRWKDKHARDTSNKLETIQDVLVKANCIADDNYFNLNPIKMESECIPDDQLLENITEINLTIY